MPLPEICRCSQVLDAATLPCVTCVNRESCQIHLLHRQLQQAQVPSPTNKRSVISACSGYLRARDDKPVLIDVSESLRKADAKHLCTGCPEKAAGSCDENRSLEALEKMAFMTHGIDVGFTVFTCRTKGRIHLPINQPEIG